jgi:hypothetical protein
MEELIRQTSDLSFNTNILIKKEDGMFVAHCLELDLVAVADSRDQARRECVALICAQIEYAFAHNNLQNLYHPAPQDVWTEFFACKAQDELRYKLESRLEESDHPAAIMPPWLIAKTCQTCHA